jgi:hypothetical protein
MTESVIIKITIVLLQTNLLTYHMPHVIRMSDWKEAKRRKLLVQVSGML